MSHRTRARALILVAALTVAAVAWPAPAAGERSFRLISMDMRQDLADAVDYGTFRAHLTERITTARPAFASGKPTLVVLPEEAGLMAWLVGRRGDLARRAGSSTAAIASLAVPYAPQVSYYAAKCPGIAPARALVLGLTDTTWRAFAEPLASLAKEHGIWIVANANVPRLTVTRDPAKVALLGDPELLTKGYAYEGGCDVYNTAFVFPPTAALDRDGAADPARTVFGAQSKAYLVPIERTQDVGLAMTGELVANVRPVVTPFARIGILTSKDAWMPDITERLDDLGMELFVQTEAGAWGGAPERDDETAWPADAMHRAIWGQVQRLPSTRYGALSNITGNFFDLYFDGAAAITKDAEPSDQPRALLGRVPERGIVARAEWAFADPPPGCGMEDVTCRRAALSASGAKLRPGSGDPSENTQREDFVWTDVTLPPLGATGARLARASGSGQGIRIAPSASPQWSPSVAAAGSGRSYIAWTDLRAGNERPASLLMTGADPGHVMVSGTSPRPYDQQGNGYDARAAALGGDLAMIWTDFRNQGWSIWGARTVGGAMRSARLVDHSPTSPRESAEGFPTENIHHDPAITASPDGTLYAAWADVRGQRTPARIAVSRSTDGTTWSLEQRADGQGALEFFGAELNTVHPGPTDDQFAPAIAAGPDGTVWVAWQDHATTPPRVLVSRSTDGARTFSTPVAVDAAGTGAQLRPAVVVASDGTVGVAWEDARTGTRRIRLALAGPDGAFRPSTAIDGSAASATQARAALSAVPGGFAVAWQDDRAGDWDVLLAYASTGGTLRLPMRIDDGPNGIDARAPALAANGAAVIVAWEDTRLGHEQIYANVVSAPAL